MIFLAHGCDQKAKIKKLFNNSGYSKVSQLLFWRIYDHFQDNNIKFEELNLQTAKVKDLIKLEFLFD